MVPPELSADQRASRSTIPLAAWTVAWVASVAAARLGPGLLGEQRPVVAWLAIAVNLAVGVLWILAHVRYLGRLDELQRSILTNALAIALGAGFVGAMAIAAANANGLISFGFDALVFAVIASAAYLIAVIAGNLRYR